MRYCIDSSVIGSPKHFVYDEGFEWKSSVPRDTWHLTGELKASPSAKCLDTLFRLIRHEPAAVPQKYVTAMSQLVTGSSQPLPWKSLLPQETFRQYFKSLVEGTSAVLSNLPTTYYDTAWTAGSRVLSALKPVKVDAEVFRELTSRESSSPALESFRPGKTGYASHVTYDRFATRTGRLTVVGGPNILVLKRDHRRLIRSAFPDGHVVYLDFSALEARIVLAESGKASDADDLYGDIAQQQFDGSVSRDTVKTAVLSELYGASRGSLGIRLGVHGDKLDVFISTVRRYFGTSVLKKRLKQEYTEKGRIHNRFGRPLFFDGDVDNLLINTYAQSSGVDVSMMGFDALLTRLGSDGIRPLFVLHDAIILDVRGDRMKDVGACTSVSVPTYEQPFPLKFDRL